jgi:hypothetical protein
MSSTTEQPSAESLIPEEAPEAVREIAKNPPAGAEGHEPITAQQEHDAVFYLLSTPQPILWQTDVKYETPEGTAVLEWIVRSLKPSEIDEPERRYLKAAGSPEDLDDIGLAAEIIVKATLRVTDKASQRIIDLNSKEFRAGVASSAEALKIRLEYQGGILPSLANEIRRISGWGPDRVGQARRVLVDVASKS